MVTALIADKNHIIVTKNTTKSENEKLFVNILTPGDYFLRIIPQKQEKDKFPEQLGCYQISFPLKLVENAQ